ncbi:MAG: starch-binding protein [Muribaculaceae bacterium]|nr:starch-binding protein [Muribaculaceae bacterium]
MKRFLLGAGALAVAASIYADGDPVETRAYYSTNPGDAVGKSATITIDGEFTDWSDDMIVATAGANDMATAFCGSHENCVLDCYALYAAWDDDNLYFAWQMVNTGDTWARPGDGPLTDGGRIGDVPFILSLSVDRTKPGMTGHLADGRFIWGDNATNGVEFVSHTDFLFFMSGKVGQGAPAMFTGNDQGATDYGANCKLFSNLGISYAMKEGFAPSHLWRQRTTADWANPGELISDPSVVNNIYDIDCYDNLMAGPVEGLKPHDTSFDSFYEIKIPMSAVGITREWLEENGIGVRLVATRGESGIDCVPFDPTMADNILGPYGKDNSTSHEKDDIDRITYALASVGHIRSNEIPTPPTPPTPPTEPVEPSEGDWTIYFVNDGAAASWSPVYTYLWDKANGNKTYAGAWPGTAMSKTTIESYGEAWCYSFAPEASSSMMVIFNNGNGSQTADLVCEAGGVYKFTGKVGEFSSVEKIAASATAMPYLIDGLTVTVSAPVTVYNAQGQVVASAAAGSFELPAPGLYIISSGNAAAKHFVR